MILRVLSLVILISVTTFISCDSDDSPSITEVERVTNLLIGDASSGTTWSLSEADVEGVDYFDEFQGLTLTFTDGVVTSTNGRELFDTSDTWNLNEEATVLTRGDGLEIELNEITANRLVIAFNIDETVFGNGRSEAVAGRNVLTFQR